MDPLRRAYPWVCLALFVALLSLLLYRSADPWQYLHDDNGAFYSAVARAHLLRGLAATGGQDFRLQRATGDRRMCGRRPSAREGLVLCLGAGSAAYVVMFPNAVQVHAYQLFYVLPLVAMASGMMFDHVIGFVSAWRLGAGRALAVVAVACTLGYSLTYTLEQYASPHAYAVRAAKELGERGHAALDASRGRV